MFDHRSHGVIRIALRVIRVAHTEIVKCIDVKMLAQLVKIKTPMISAVKGAVLAAVNQHEVIARASFEISGSHAVQRHELRIIHYGFLFRYGLFSPDVHTRSIINYLKSLSYSLAFSA